MIKNNEPYLIEYNVRMGDPETEVVVPHFSDAYKMVENLEKALGQKIQQS